MVTPKARLLLIEGKRGERPSFFSGLTRKGFDVISVASGSAALLRLENMLPDLVLIDAASMRTSGKRICQLIRQKAPGVPIVVIVETNAENSEKLEADAVLTLPFTLQKLLNRIRPLLPAEENKDVVKAGPLVLDLSQRWVRNHSHQASLTPRLVMLLKALMDRSGEVIERTELFSRVWETAYTGDTRTLDVHISWLRQAVEDDPRKPRYIKTVRGVGYRLDVDAMDEQSTRPLKKSKS